MDLSIQFAYDQPDLGQSQTLHRITALSQHGGQLGSMLWDTRHIRNIGVASDQQRRGIATAMWHEGHRMAAENRSIPKPKHSADRTAAGEAWARSVGGRLPRRLVFEGSIGEARPA